MKPFSHLRAPLGLALALDRVVLTHPDGRVVERHLEPWDGSATWPDLTHALVELATEGHGRPLAVAILPPLVESRRVELPKLDDDARRAVLRRDQGKHYPQAKSGMVVEGTPIGASIPQKLLVTRVSENLLLALEHGMQQAGIALGAVVPAEAAWLAGMGEGSGTRTFVTSAGVVSLQVENGALVAVRRGVATEGEDGVIAAARGAARVRAPELLSTSRRNFRVDGESRLFHRALGVVAAALFLAAVLHTLDLRRELAQVRARRAELHPEVERLIDLRTAAEGAASRVATLESLSRSRPRWIGVIARVSDGLPRDAYLTALRGTPDSLVLEGVAPQATSVFEALRATPGIVAVRAEAPYRQETDATGVPVEHFAFGTRWTPATRGGE